MAILNSPDDRGCKTVIALVADIISLHERKGKFAGVPPSLKDTSTNRLLRKLT